MIYHQSTGQLFDDAGKFLGVGHAGNGAGLNNPAMQYVHDVGPLPVGRYKVGAFIDRQGLGYSARLTPQPVSTAGIEYAWLRGRGGFLMHLPELSEGCIAMERPILLAVSQSGDTDLTVVS